ncbi:L-type lectin-domain containing protein [Roseateles sp. NT4]|uniref:L-type lectin-domain containing protein n=1 Tax=Roseateles sp. NT4 TaxID=3453715 RepID=UPI003EED9450
MTRRSLFAAAALALAAAAPQAQAALVIDYANFTGACASSLTCVGSTAVNGGDLRLTPSTFNAAGAGFSTTAISLGAGATFSTGFQFRMDQAGGIDPADGFTFVLSKASSGLGGVGGGLGYQGVANSVAIEFDTYDNGETGGSNHVAVDVNGSLNSLATASPYGVNNCHLGNHLAAGCMSNGKIWSAFVNYDGNTKLLNVSVQESGSALIQLITDFSIDIAAALGTNDAFVGFTAATGSGIENHDILNWQLANDTSITGPGNRLPEPTSLALMSFAGLAALAAGRRRRAA